MRDGGSARLAIAVVVMIAASTRHAIAQPSLDGSGSNDQQAMALYRQGMRHYDLAEFGAAVDAFKAAYRLSPDPELLFNVAQSYRRMGPDGCNEALEFYRNYQVAAATPAPEIAARITEMERCVADRVVTASEAPAPTSTPAPMTAEKPAANAHESRWPELALAGAGVTGAIAGGWLRTRATSSADDLWRACGSTCPDDEIGAIRRNAIVGAGLLIAGGLAVTGAAAMWWLRDGNVSRTSISLAPHGAGLMVRGVF